MGNTVTRSHIRDADRGVAKATRDNTRRNSAFPSTLAHHSSLPCTVSSPPDLNSPSSTSPLSSAQFPHPNIPQSIIPDSSQPLVDLPSKLSLSRPDPPVDPPLPPRAVRQRTVETSPDRASQITKRRQRHASADIAFSRSMSANSSVHNDNRSTRSNSSSFPASAPEPNLNFQPDSIHTTDRDDPNALHRLTSRIPSTSAPITSSTSNSTSLPLTDTPPPSSNPDHTENTLPSPPNSNSTYRSVPRIDPTLPGASLKDCQTARTQTPPRVDKPPRARKVVSFNENVRIVTYPYEGSDTYSSSSELPSLNRFPDKPSKRRGRSLIRILSRSPPTSPHHSADPFDSAPYDAFSPSALGLQTEIVYDHITSRPPLTIDYSDGDPDREDDDSSPANPSEDNSYIVAMHPPPTHPSHPQNSPAPENAVVEDCFDYTDRRDSDNDDTLSLSDAHPSCDGIDEPEAIVDPLRSVGQDDLPNTRAGSSFDIAPLWQRLKRVDELDAVDMQRTSLVKPKKAPQSIPATVTRRRFASDSHNLSTSAKDVLAFSRQPRNISKAQQLLSELSPPDPICVSDTITSVVASENVAPTSSSTSVATSTSSSPSSSSPSSNSTPASNPTSTTPSASNSNSSIQQPKNSSSDAHSIATNSQTASDPTNSCPTQLNEDIYHSDSDPTMEEGNCLESRGSLTKDQTPESPAKERFLDQRRRPSSLHLDALDARSKSATQSKLSESSESDGFHESSGRVGATCVIFSKSVANSESGSGTRESSKPLSRWLARENVSDGMSAAKGLNQTASDNKAEIESERLVSTDEKWEDARPMSSSIEKFGCHVTAMSCLKRDVIQSTDDHNFVLSRDPTFEGLAHSSGSKRRKVEREVEVGLEPADPVGTTHSSNGRKQNSENGNELFLDESATHEPLHSPAPIGDRELPMLGSLVMDASSRDIARKYSNESRSSTAGRISWRGGDRDRKNKQSLSGPTSDHSARNSVSRDQDDEVAGNLFHGEATDEAELSLAQPALSENSSTPESEFDESGNFANENLLSERMDVNAGDYSDDEILSDLDLDAIQISSHDDYSVPGIVQGREASPLAGVYYGTSSPSVVDQQSHETDGSGAEGPPRYPEYKVLNGLLKDEIMFRSGLHSSDFEEEGEWGVIVPREERVIEQASAVKLKTRTVKRSNGLVGNKQPEKVVPEVLLHEWSGDTPVEPAIEMEDSLPNSRSSSSPNLAVEEGPKISAEASNPLHKGNVKLELEITKTYENVPNLKSTDGERRLPSAVRPSSTTRRRKSSSSKVNGAHMTVDEIAAGFGKTLKNLAKGSNANVPVEELALDVAKNIKMITERLEPNLFDASLKAGVPRSDNDNGTRTEEFEDGDQVEVGDRTEQKRLRRKEFIAPLPNGYAKDPRLQDFQLSVERKSVSEIGYRRNRRGSNGTSAALALTNVDETDGSVRALGNDEIRIRPNLFERGASFVEHDYGRAEVFRTKAEEDFGYKWDTRRRYGGLRGRRLSNVETTGRIGGQEENVAHRGVVGRLRSRMHMARKLVSPNQ